MWSQNREMRERVVQAYRHFVMSRNTRDNLPRVPHECSNECEWFEYERVFICRESGFVHVCTAEFCDRYVVGVSERPCVLTGVLYPLDFVEEFSDHCIKQVDGTSRGSTGVITSSSSRAVTDNTFLNVLWDLCRIQHGVACQQTEIEQYLGGHHLAVFVSQVCRRLWCLINETAYFKENTARYQPDYHGMVVLYIMRNTGLAFDDGQPLVVVPLIESLQKALPNLKHISDNKQWKCGRFTPADKIFHACVGQIPNSILITYQRWLQDSAGRCGLRL